MPNNLIMVSEAIQKDAELFLNNLLTATNGFYFLEAKNEKDLQYLCGWDYRNTTIKGLTLVLASVFKTRADYVQAKGRVSRSGDEGRVLALPRKMF